MAETYVCNRCEPDDWLDSNALVLSLKLCAAHGYCWHRLMRVLPDGRKDLAMPLDPERKRPSQKNPVRKAS